MTLQFIVLEIGSDIKSSILKNPFAAGAYSDIQAKLHLNFQICSDCANATDSQFHAKVTPCLPFYTIVFIIKMKQNESYRSVEVKDNRSMQHTNHVQETLASCKNTRLRSHEAEQLEKLKKASPVCSRHNSSSSCSNDSTFYRRSRRLAEDSPLSAQNSINKMVKIDKRYATKRHRNSSGSSALSSASDSSHKELRPLGINGIHKHLISPRKHMAGDLSEMSANISDVRKAGSPCDSVTSTENSTVKEIVEEKTVSILCNSSMPKTHSSHNLRKRIRKKTCCNCDCGSAHTTVIVRRYTQIQHKTRTKQYSPPQNAKLKVSDLDKPLLLPSPESFAISEEHITTETFATPKLKKHKRRRTEIDKLYDDLHELDWAKNISQDNILSVDFRRTSTSSLYSNVQNGPSVLQKTMRKTSKAFQNVDTKLQKPNNSFHVPKSWRENRKRFCKIETSTVILPFNDCKSPEILSSTANDTSPRMHTYKETITDKVHVSSACIDTLPKERVHSSSSTKMLGDSLCKMTPSMSETLPYCDHFSLSLEQSEALVDKFENATDSENSSFALDISPLNSDDETVQETFLSQAVTTSNDDENFYHVLSPNDIENPPALENQTFERIRSPFKDANIPLLSPQCIPNIERFTAAINKSKIQRFALANSKIDTDLIAEATDFPEKKASVAILSKDVQKPLEDGIFASLRSANTEESIQPTSFSIEEVESVGSKDVELAIPADTGSVVVNMVEDKFPLLPMSLIHPPADSLDCDIMVFQSDINEVEIEIPCTTSDLSYSEFMDVSNDIEKDIVIPEKPVEYDEVKDHSEQILDVTQKSAENFKNVKNGVAFPANWRLTRKRLKKYLSRSKNKLMPNEIATTESQIISCESSHNSLPHCSVDLVNNSVTIPEGSAASLHKNVTGSRFETKVDVTNTRSEAKVDVTNTRSESKVDVTSNGSDTRVDVTTTGSETKMDVMSNRAETKVDVASNGSENKVDATSNSLEDKVDVTSNGSEYKGDVTSDGSEYKGDVTSDGSENKVDMTVNRLEEIRPAQPVGNCEHMEALVHTNDSNPISLPLFASNCIDIKSPTVLKVKAVKAKVPPKKLTTIQGSTAGTSASSAVPLINTTSYVESPKNSRHHVKKEIKQKHFTEVSNKGGKSKRKGHVYNEQLAIENAKRIENANDILHISLGFTFHYKCITVNRNDSCTKIILKLTKGQNIFLSAEALTELKDTFTTVMNDVNCRVLILIGTGSCFCSGIDLKPLLGENRKEAAKEIAVAIKEFIEVIAAFYKPLVSVVNGAAVGFGVTLLTFSDIILASDTATFSMPENQLGYFPEGAGTFMLPRVVGLPVAMDMIFRGRKLTAQEAENFRLVSEVVKSSQIPHELMTRVKLLEGNSSAAMETTKGMARVHYFHTLNVTLENEVEILPKQWLSQICQEALQTADRKGLL